MEISFMNIYKTNDIDDIVDMILWECYQQAIDPKTLFQKVLDDIRKDNNNEN